jgi:hypothetical protein
MCQLVRRLLQHVAQFCEQQEQGDQNGSRDGERHIAWGSISAARAPGTLYLMWPESRP